MDFFESDMCNQNLTPDMLKKIAGDKSKKVDVHDKFVEFLYDDLDSSLIVSEARADYFRRYKENRHNSMITRAKTPETKSTETIEREEKEILHIYVPERLKDKTIIIEINHGDSREHILVDSATKRFRI